MTLDQLLQRRTEKSVLEKYSEYAESHPDLNECVHLSLYVEAGVENRQGTKSLRRLKLERDVHASYLARGLNYLSRWMVALDASKPWLTYWILHALDLLEVEISQDIIER